MAVGHVIWRAYEAIYEANATLVAAGMTPAKIPAHEQNVARRIVDAEVVTCLREPARALVTLIANRSAVLAQEEAEEAALREEIGANATWGLF